MKLEKILRAGALGLALVASSVAAKAQIVVNTTQVGNTFGYTIINNYTGGSSNSLSSFTIPVYGYQGSYTFNTGGWSLTGNTPLTYNTSNDGASLTFSADESADNVQPNGNSITLSVQASGPSLALTSQTANFGLGGGGSYSTTINSPGLAAVPEPSTYGAIMAGSGLAYAFWRRRRAMAANNPPKSDIKPTYK